MRTETEFERIVRQADWYASVDASSGLAHHLKAYWPEIKAEITKLRAERDAAARDMRERSLAAVEKLRIHAATNFKDANCQGQRGQDRTDALYDAYHAIRVLALIATDQTGGAA